MNSTKTLHPLRSFSVRVKGWEHSSIRNARSAGQAKADYLLDVRESYRDVKYTDIRVNVAGPAVESPGFRRCMEYRDVPFAKIGMRVEVGGKPGVIVGHNASANLNVLFDETGFTLNCHPNCHVTYFDEAGNVIRSYGEKGEIR